MSLKFVPKVRINNIPSLVQIMAWRRPGDKPLSEPMMVSLLTQICVTRPQWVKSFAHCRCQLIILLYLLQSTCNIKCGSPLYSYFFLLTSPHCCDFICIDYHCKYNAVHWEIGINMPLLMPIMYICVVGEPGTIFTKKIFHRNRNPFEILFLSNSGWINHNDYLRMTRQLCCCYMCKHSYWSHGQ